MRIVYRLRFTGSYGRKRSTKSFSFLKQSPLVSEEKIISLHGKAHRFGKNKATGHLVLQQAICTDWLVWHIGEAFISVYFSAIKYKRNFGLSSLHRRDCAYHTTFPPCVLQMQSFSPSRWCCELDFWSRRYRSIWQIQTASAMFITGCLAVSLW